MLIRLGRRVRRRLPRPVATALAIGAGNLCWAFLWRRRQVVAANLARIASDRTLADRRRLCRATFRNLAVCVSDFLAFPFTTRTSLRTLVPVTSVDLLREAHRRGRGVIVLTAHLGNPELGGIMLSALGFPTYAVAEPIPPPVFELYRRHRTATGLHLVALGSGVKVRELRRALNRGDVVALICDRAITRRQTQSVAFAGGRRPVPTGPARLALTSGATLLFAYAVLATGDPGHRYRLVVDCEIPTTALGADPVTALTARIATHIEALVRQYPDQWFVFQPEWLDDDDARAAGAGLDA